MKRFFVRRPVAAIAGVGLALAVTPRFAVGATWSFAKVADTSTVLPGGGTVASFDEPTFDGINLAFRATLTGGSTRAIFMAGPRGIEQFVTTGTTTIPGGGAFDRLGTPVIDDGNIAFVGGASTREGLYLLARPGYSSGPQVVADTTMLAPGTAQNFTEFENRGQPSIDGSNVAFAAGFTGSSGGVYLKSAGGLQRVADQSTQIPGRGTNFLFFDKVNTENGAVVFQGGRGGGGFNGVYTTLGGTLRSVASDLTTMPDGFKFATEGALDRGHTLSNGKVGFYGMTNGKYGVWTEQSPGAFDTVAQVGSVVPGYGTIQGMDNQAYDNGKSIVQASTGGVYGLYSNINGQLEPVTPPSGPFDGKTLTSAGIISESYRGRRFAFRANFNDGSQALYVATASAPPASAVMQPFTSGGLLDNAPHNGTGDSTNTSRFLQRTAGGTEHRAAFEYNLVDYGGISLQSAFFDGLIQTNNSFDTGPRQIGVEIYGADGIIKTTDFSLSGVLAEQIVHNPSLASTTPFHIDLTDEIQSLLNAGQTMIGVRLTPLNDQAASVIVGSDLPTLAISVPEPSTVAVIAAGLLPPLLRRRRRSDERH